MLRIKKVNVFSLAKILTVVYAFLGFVVGVVVAVFAAMGIDVSGSGNVTMGLGVVAIFILPFLYGILGFFSGILSGGIYNIAAKFLGGIEIETE